LRTDRSHILFPLTDAQTIVLHLSSFFRPLLTGWDWTTAGAAADDVDAAAALLEECLRAKALEPFATFVTTRAKLRLDDVSIDADVADFGHAVTELEVMVADEGEVEAAEKEIARVASLLGAEPLDSSTGGKLETFIRRFCPSVLEQLVEAGVLKD
jgi:hypothetical protein